ncbi:MAG TPA: sulfide/dihydroorotate dehydrogenase-like FAD/NAD-binding protein [candidate division Zixibacteria bacterium]|nr:sulfide/dihydroorotate dehydrogenase-like FAD/NAD-binding protein [candidate division Zixibacteria bacterium]
MNKIIEKIVLSKDVKQYIVECSAIAQKALAGQFVVIRICETGERIPLTIADSDKAEGTITLIVQEVGKTTRQMGFLEVGDSILDIAGPLGTPSEIEHFGTVVMIGGGIGIAPLYPITKAMKAAGNKVISIIGARCADLLFYQDLMAAQSDMIIETTDDGTCGRQGFVTDALSELIESGERIDRVVAIGPAIMMKMVAETTRPHGIPTIASLNSIMVDGTGMCGACRVEVGGETKFACVDGPDFDAHAVNFDLLIQRLAMYLPEEKIADEHFCRCSSAKEGEKNA